VVVAGGGRAEGLARRQFEDAVLAIGHSDEAIFYLMTRGISEEEARAMLVRGFVEPISKELPLEYAVEMNNLINLELEGSIG